MMRSDLGRTWKLARVDPPEIERQPLSEMTDDDIQARIDIEETAADEPQSVNGSFRAERPLVMLGRAVNNSARPCNRPTRRTFVAADDGLRAKLGLSALPRARS